MRLEHGRAQRRADPSARQGVQTPRQLWRPRRSGVPIMGASPASHALCEKVRRYGHLRCQLLCAAAPARSGPMPLNLCGWPGQPSRGGQSQDDERRALEQAGPGRDVGDIRHQRPIRPAAAKSRLTNQARVRPDLGCVR